MCDYRGDVDGLTAAQVVHSTNKIGRKPAGEAGVTHVSAVFHSHLLDLNTFSCVAIF
ncbi:hypothetical protein [Stenotrophomonas sp. SrG]|uniref:hypothetical protein n=1 Tax=Stenotrophomonas sp. SrG TaxID=3414430 RepID=UPI003CEFCD12